MSTVGLCVDIDEEGFLVLKTTNGDTINGVKTMTVFTGVEELSEVNVNIILEGDVVNSITHAMIGGKVK